MPYDDFFPIPVPSRQERLSERLWNILYSLANSVEESVNVNDSDDEIDRDKREHVHQARCEVLEALLAYKDEP